MCGIIMCGWQLCLLCCPHSTQMVERKMRLIKVYPPWPDSCVDVWAPPELGVPRWPTAAGSGCSAMRIRAATAPELAGRRAPHQVRRSNAPANAAPQRGRGPGRGSRRPRPKALGGICLARHLRGWKVACVLWDLISYRISALSTWMANPHTSVRDDGDRVIELNLNGQSPHRGLSGKK